MAVKNIFGRLNLDRNWVQVSVSENNFYLIAIKEESQSQDTIDVDKVLQIRFEIAIDSGIANKPLTIQYVTLNFNETTSSDPELNKITAFTRLLNLPATFYIRAVSVFDGDRDITSGQTAIDVNINAVDLGVN